MELVLKSRLGDFAPHLGRADNRLGVLLVYEDIGFVNSTMELLRDAAGRVEATGRLFCAVWGFDFFEDPLLTQIASGEAAAADLVVVAQRCCAGLSINMKLWFGLWASMHADGQTEIAAPDFLCHLQELGRLGDINLLAIGGSRPLAGEFMEVVRRALGRPSHESVDAERGYFLLGHAVREKEHLKRPGPLVSAGRRSI